VESFFKYHALGNDFVVVDRRATGVDITAEEARLLCARHTGIGADGVLAILPAEGAAGRMVVHNADGSVAEMCGNGIRCVARYLGEDPEATRADTMIIDTGAGKKDCLLEWKGDSIASVTVDMGIAEHAALSGQLAQGVLGTAVSMGNPHFVLFDTPPSEAARLGPQIENDPSFPNRTNVEFVVVKSPTRFEVVVWERGVGLTQACGTGACAAVAVGARLSKAPVGQWVTVALPGGELEVKVENDGRVWMRGPATFVFKGTLPA
jgi:diaminopimelate epimerase